MIRSGKIKKVKSKLRAKMILNKDLIFDLKQGDLDIVSLVQELFKEALDIELEKNGREIANVKEPVEIIVTVKTRRKKK